MIERPAVGKLVLVLGAACAVILAWAPIWPLGQVQATNGGGWTALGPEAASVAALSLSPTFETDSILFAGTAGGVFRSIDAGGTWQEVNTDLTNLDVRALSLSPAFETDSIVFVGTADGVFRSSDGGGTWQEVNTDLTNVDVQALSLSPAFETDSIVFVGTADGVFRGIALEPGTLAPPTLQSLAVTPSIATVLVERTLQLTAVGTFDDSTTQDLTATVTWTSSDQAVVTITAGGLATAVGPGTVTITATDPTTSTSDTATLTVIISTAVPSHSQWGLIGMAGLFAVLILVGLRRRAQARHKAG